MPSLWLAAFVFVVYAAGACATIYVGDSGELVSAVHLLGIPHPSGYPLYVLLGKLWTLVLPVGSIAYRMSLFSAFCAAATVGVLHSLCRRLGLHPLACLFAGLLFAFSPSLWGEANVQRVYSLNALFVAVATASAFSWYRSREVPRLVLAFFVCGLGTANHTFMAIYGACLLVFVVVVEPSLFRRARPLVLSVVGFVAGLLPYLYLPLRSRADPLLDWGNPETLRSFLDVVFRRDFWERAWIETPSDLLVIAADYLAGVGRELLWVGAAMALFGAVMGRRKQWAVLLALLVMVANLATMALHGSRSDIFIWHRYYIPSYFMAALLAAMGCHLLLEYLPRRVRLLPLAVPVLGLAIGWPRFDRSRYAIAEDFSHTLLEALPPGAHLSASDDNILFVLIYLHFVEGQRPDVNLILQGVGDTDLPPLKFNPDNEPLFFTHHPNWSVEGLEIVPVGLVFRTVRFGGSLPEPVWQKETLEGELDTGVPKDYLTQNLIGQFHFMIGSTFETRDWPRAARSFDAAQKAAPDNDVLFYNLGLIYRRNGLLEDALAAFSRSHEINPRHIASKNRVRAADRLDEIQEERARLRPIEEALSRETDVPPGSVAYHLRMAQLLDERGETAAAHGYRLRALVQETERDSTMQPSR